MCYLLILFLDHWDKMRRATTRSNTSHGITYQKETHIVEGDSQITVLVFRDRNGRIIGWATNTSAGIGPLPTTIAGFFPNGALCYLIALFMCNISFFWEKGMMMPQHFISFVQENRIGHIDAHQLFERDDFTKLATVLDVVLTVEPDLSHLEGASVFGTSGKPVLEKVHLRVRDRHYVVPVLDDTPEEKKAQSVSAPLAEIACSVCTFLNSGEKNECDMCTAVLNTAAVPVRSPAVAPVQHPSVTPTEIVCKTCTVFNPVGTENCEVCGASFTGGCDVTRLG